MLFAVAELLVYVVAIGAALAGKNTSSKQLTTKYDHLSIKKCDDDDN